MSRVKKILLSVSGLFLFSGVFISGYYYYNINDNNLGARTDNFWNLRAGTYLETAISGGYNLLVNGTNKYINFGSVSGSSGYGLRDNSGSMEFKDNSGSWTDLSNSASQWTSSGTDIYYDSGNVGIGTTIPATKLDVNGVITATGGNSTSWNSKADYSFGANNFDGSGNFTTTGDISFANGTSTTKLTVNELCFSGDGCQTAVISTGEVVTLYHWNQSSDIAGYERLRTSPDSGTEIAETATSSSGSYGLIDSYVSTTTDLSVTSIPAGVWSFHTYANIDSNTGVSKMVMNVYVRTASGDEKLLLVATSAEMTTGLKEYEYNGIGQATTTNATDRIVIKPYCYSDSLLARTCSFYYDGLTNYSHVVTPLSLSSVGYTRKGVDETITGSWTFSSSLTVTNLTATNATSTNLNVSGSTYLSNTIFSGALSFTGDGSFAFPNSATCVVSGTTGKTCFDTTSGQLQIYTGSATSTFVSFKESTLTIASTSWLTTATTTIPLGFATNAETWSTIGCYTDTATATLQFGDGTNYMTAITATTSVVNYTQSSNNSFTALEKRNLKIWNFTGTPNYLTCVVKKSYDSD